MASIADFCHFPTDNCTRAHLWDSVHDDLLKPGHLHIHLARNRGLGSSHSAGHSQEQMAVALLLRYGCMRYEEPSVCGFQRTSAAGLKGLIIFYAVSYSSLSNKTMVKRSIGEEICLLSAVPFIYPVTSNSSTDFTLAFDFLTLLILQCLTANTFTIRLQTFCSKLVMCRSLCRKCVFVIVLWITISRCRSTVLSSASIESTLALPSTS